MNLQQPANDEGEDNFLRRDVVSTCVHGSVRVYVCVCAGYLASSLAHMPSVTQPPHRNPKLGRLVRTRDL